MTVMDSDREAREATLLSGEWIPRERLNQIRRELTVAGFQAWSNPVDIDIAELERCALCAAPCRYQGFQGFVATAIHNGIPQRWSLAVCTACGAGESF